MTNLEDPIDLAGLNIRNRFVMAPMATGFAKETCEVSDRLIQHYERCSKENMGLVITEGASVNHDPQHRFRVGITDDRFIPGLKKLVERIKVHGARAFVQLAHGGPKALRSKRLVGPSAIRVMESGPLPDELTVDEILSIQDGFVDAARRAQTAGFDGIELHGAHFYLLSAFLSSYTNQRDDDYGGSTEKKTKLLVDIIKGIRKELGSFPVIGRFNGIENFVRGIDITEAIKIAQILERSGVDALHISGVHAPYFNSSELARFTAETRPKFLEEYHEECFIPCATVIREEVNIPVIGVGYVRDAAFAEQVIQRDLCDLLGLGRALLADPKFATKTLTGNNNMIIQCTDCMLCFKRLGEMKPIECSVNPDL